MFSFVPRSHGLAGGVKKMPSAKRAMAARARSTTVEIDSSHVAMISQPNVVTDPVLQAAGG